MKRSKMDFDFGGRYARQVADEIAAQEEIDDARFGCTKEDDARFEAFAAAREAGHSLHEAAKIAGMV